MGAPQPMPPRRLSVSAQRFLLQEVHSVMQLELVLLLARDPSRAWSPSEAARELRISESWARVQLDHLRAPGVTRAGDHAESYGLDVDGVWTAAIAEIAAEYPRRRTSIIQHILSAPDRPR